MVGILHIRLTLRHLLHPGHTGILVTTHTHNIVVSLILNRSAGIKGFYGIIGSLEVITRTGFVAKTPDNNTGVVYMASNHLHITGNMGSLPFLRMRE